MAFAAQKKAGAASGGDPGIKGGNMTRVGFRQRFGLRCQRTEPGRGQLENRTVTIEGHRTYMKLTGAVFKQTLLSL
jgi:hypothetical protein